MTRPLSRPLRESKPAPDRFILADLDLVPYEIDYQSWYRLSGKRDPLCVFFPSLVINTTSLLVDFSQRKRNEES